jgi:hypothetical protein
VWVTSRKLTSLTVTLVFKVSEKVLAKFHQNPDLGWKVESAQNFDSANRSSFRSHNSQIANRMDPYYWPPESW